MKLKKEFIIGVVTLIGIVGLVLGFLFLQGQEVWKNRATYYAMYKNSEGVSTGSPVQLKGLKIGTVVGVSFPKNSLTNVVVKMEITNEKAQRIPLGTIAKLNSDLLAGAYIDFIWSDDTTFFDFGDTINSDVSLDIEDQINERLLPLEQKTNELISTADSAIQTIEAIFSRNTDNLDESFLSIRRAIKNFERVSLKIDTMITREKFKVSRVLTNVEEITSNLKKSNDDLTNIFSNVSKLSDSLALVDFTSVVNNANSAIEQVNILMDDIKNGDGTLTLLMNDSTLYNNVNLMLEETTRLIENVKTHPKRYVRFSLFGGKDKSLLDSREERMLKDFVNDSL